MAFEYTPYRSPYVGAIADLIGQRGDIAAQRALNEAKARSQAVSSVAQSLGNLAQYQADAPKREMERMRVAAARQEMADKEEARSAGRSLAAMAFDPNKGRFQPEGPSLETPTGVLPEQDGFTTSVDGVELFDKAKVGQRMAELGHGAWMLEHGNKIDDLNKSLLETDALEKQSLQKAAATWANMPEPLQLAGASEILKVMGKRLSPEQLSILRQQIDSGDVAGLRAAISPLLPKPETQMISAGATMLERQPDGTWKTVASGAQPQETTAQYNARVNAARAKIKAGTATPEEQALVEGVDADIAARRTPQSVPLDKEHADLLTKKANGTLTPAETMRLQSIEQVRKFIPQFNVTNRQERLVQVRRFDPKTGTNVVEFVPESEARGGPYRAPIGSAEISRKHTATALTQTGDDVIKSLQSPALAKQLGIVMGRYNTLEDFIGNPPPEFARLAGELKSFSAANMTVHGFRSSTGAQKVFEMLNQKQTPEALIEKIKGLMQFTKYYLNEFGDTDTDASADDPLGLGPAPR